MVSTLITGDSPNVDHHVGRFRLVELTIELELDLLQILEFLLTPLIVLPFEFDAFSKRRHRALLLHAFTHRSIVLIGVVGQFRQVFLVLLLADLEILSLPFALLLHLIALVHFRLELMFETENFVVLILIVDQQRLDVVRVELSVVVGALRSYFDGHLRAHFGVDLFAQVEKLRSNGIAIAQHVGLGRRSTDVLLVDLIDLLTKMGVGIDETSNAMEIVDEPRVQSVQRRSLSIGALPTEFVELERMRASLTPRWKRVQHG